MRYKILLSLEYGIELDIDNNPHMQEARDFAYQIASQAITDGIIKAKDRWSDIISISQCEFGDKYVRLEEIEEIDD